MDVLCAAPGHCTAADPSECTRRALSEWSTLRNRYEIRCVYRVLEESCALGDKAACGFAGRLALSTEPGVRDVAHGFAMLLSACYAGFELDCEVAKEWLSAPGLASKVAHPEDIGVRVELQHRCLTGAADSCYQLARLAAETAQGLAADLELATASYERGCRLGLADACNDFGDALAYGRGVARDRSRSAANFERACRLGEPLGCANLGYMVEHGYGVPEGRARARGLYGIACVAGLPYGCLHAAMMDAPQRGAPIDPNAALDRWTTECGKGDATACSFIGVLWEDGPDGEARDEQKSQAAMNRACALGSRLACEWVNGRDDP
jgi:hypothetical protein